MEFLDAEYWSERYAQNTAQWDLGAASPPLAKYFDQLKDKKIRILIPGAGNAYEAEYLLKAGFENVFVLDISAEPLQNLRNRCPLMKAENCIEKDFFDFSGQFDLIVEQTFFCAISPSLRQLYAQKMADLLVKDGKLVGLLFDANFKTNPPFGGSRNEYLTYFSPYFDFIYFDKCQNSILPRQGNELFMNLRKRVF